MYEIYLWLRKHLRQIIALWSSFTAATVLGNLNNSWNRFVQSMMDFRNMANIIFYIFSTVIVIALIMYFISSKIAEQQNPTKNFLKLMNSKTVELFCSDTKGQMDFSWGYNKNIHRSKNPSGWSPLDFWIEYDNNSLYEFPITVQNGLVGYTRKDYNGPCVKTKKQDIYREQLLT